MDAEVRAADPADIAAIVALREEVAGELKWIAARPGADADKVAARMEESLDGPATKVFVATVDGVIEGSLSIELAPYGVADFGMFVRATQRGRGLGRLLLEAALEWARSAGAHKVSLECWPHNTAAIALYRKYGFEEEGRKRRHYRRGGGEAAWDSVIMGLLLDPDIPGSPYGD